MGVFEDGLAFFNSEKFVLLDYGLGSVPIPEEWNQMALYNPHHMFYYMVEGCFEVTSISTHTKTVISPGHAFLIPSGVYDFVCLAPSVVFAVHFMCPLKDEKDLLEGLFENVTEIDISRDDYVLNNTLSCFKHGQITNADIVLFKGLLHQIVGRVLKENAKLASHSHFKQHSELSLQVMNYVKKHLSAQLKVCDIAEEFHYHPNYLSKLFFTENGITLKRYIEMQLYRKALILIAASDKPVGDLALELRFSSQFYFSNFIKKHLGTSPENFRKIQGSLLPNSQK